MAEYGSCAPWLLRKKLVKLAGSTPAVDDLSGSGDLDGSIGLTFTVPDGATSVFVNYSVDQTAAPSAPDRGISLGHSTDGTISLSGVSVEYGASYKFAAWGLSGQGYSDTADTVTVDGPLNPGAYGENVLWVDARRETAYADNTDVTSPQDFSDSALAFSQSTASKRPHWLDGTTTGGINSLPAFLFDDAAYQVWDGPTDNLQGVDGLSVFALTKTNELAASQYLISKWEDTTPDRHFAFGKLSGVDYVCYFSSDGSSSAFVQGGGNSTGPWGVGACWTPGEQSTYYTDGALDDTDTSINYASLHSDTDAILRIGSYRHSVAVASADYWSGMVTIILVYSESLDGLAGELLGDALADLGGK